MATPYADTVAESNWPGERNPSRHDVRDAIKVPDYTFLDRFKVALLASTDASDNEDLMKDVEMIDPSSSKYTYPLAMLEGLPRYLPPPAEPQDLRHSFQGSCSEQPFLNKLPIPGPTTEAFAAPLRFAILCLASLHDRRAEEESNEMFFTASSLWGTIMETDNREARSVELLVAAILAVAYGAVSSDDAVRHRSNLLLCSAMTITRRMRLDSAVDISSQYGHTNVAYGGNIMWSLWMLDILHSLHFNGTVITFTSRELRTAMPGSDLMFQDAYRAMLDDRTDNPSKASDESCQEGVLLLLMAVLSDLIYVRGSLGHATLTGHHEMANMSCTNPYISFSASSEVARMEGKLALALSRWHDQYFGLAAPEVRAFYHYCSLYSSCPQLPRLNFIANDATKDLRSRSQLPDAVSDEAVRSAWLVLDNVSEWSQDRSSDSMCPIWFPIILYHAAIVVWAQHWCSQRQSGKAYYASAKMLIPFKIELGQIHWPCCKNMVATLDRLIVTSKPVVEA